MFMLSSIYSQDTHQQSGHFGTVSERRIINVNVDKAWEQEKPEARKMFVNAAREASHTSGERRVGLR
jgi:hypothetical protein